MLMFFKFISCFNFFHSETLCVERLLIYFSSLARPWSPSDSCRVLIVYMCWYMSWASKLFSSVTLSKNTYSCGRICNLASFWKRVLSSPPSLKIWLRTAEGEGKWPPAGSCFSTYFSLTVS